MYLAASFFLDKSFVFFFASKLSFVVLALMMGLLLTFEQIGLGCFFSLGLESFAGCVHRSAKKCKKAQKSSKKLKKVQGNPLASLEVC